MGTIISYKGIVEEPERQNYAPGVSMRLTTKASQVNKGVRQLQFNFSYSGSCIKAVAFSPREKTSVKNFEHKRKQNNQLNKI